MWCWSLSRWRTQHIERATGPARCQMDSQSFYSDGDGDEAIRPLAVRPQKAAKILGICLSSLERLHKAEDPSSSDG